MTVRRRPGLTTRAAGTSARSLHHPTASTMRSTTVTVTPRSVPTPARCAGRSRGQRRAQLSYPQPGQHVERVRRHPAGPQQADGLRFVVDEPRQPPTHHPTMTGLDIARRPMIATSPAQQRPFGWKTILPKPHPGLSRARDRPGRRIHHHEPQPGHRLHHIPARFDNLRLSDTLEEPPPRVPAAPTPITVGQQVCERRHVRHTTVDVEHHHPLAPAHLPDPNHLATRHPRATPTSTKAPGRPPR